MLLIVLKAGFYCNRGGHFTTPFGMALWGPATRGGAVASVEG